MLLSVPHTVAALHAAATPLVEPPLLEDEDDEDVEPEDEDDEVEPLLEDDDVVAPPLLEDEDVVAPPLLEDEDEVVVDDAPPSPRARTPPSLESSSSSSPVAVLAKPIGVVDFGSGRAPLTIVESSSSPYSLLSEVDVGAGSVVSGSLVLSPEAQPTPKARPVNAKAARTRGASFI